MNVQLARFVRLGLAALVALTVVTARAEPYPAPQTHQGEAPDTVAEKKGGAITGQVICDGHPLAGATVRASNGGQHTSAVTDDDGSFTIPGLPPGVFGIRVDAPGYVVEPGPTGGYSQYRPGDFVKLVLVKGGVITGRVTDAAGDPVGGAQIRAIRVRDASGKPSRPGYRQQSTRTDDRGVYRIYGLRAGSYVVAAGGTDDPFQPTGAYDRDAATYHPSSTRASAVVVPVNADEATGIDIQYRGDRGHRISGTLHGPSRDPERYAAVFLVHLNGEVAVET